MKLKNLLSFCAVLLLAFSVHGQMTQLNITLDASVMQNPDCWLNAGAVTNNKVYMHSGLCVSNPTTCDSIGAGGTPIWQHVVGNWGLDDGIGQMTYVSGTTWNMSMIIENYYTTMPAQSTPYTIGFVFRDLDGTFEGKDDQCGDIFITNIQGTPVVKNGSTGLVYTPVTVTKTVVGVEVPGVFDFFQVGPNPFSDVVKIDYHLRDAVNEFSVKVFNNLGQQVVTLTEGTGVAGSHRIVWEGNGNNGQQLENGVYYLSMWAGQQRLATEKVLLFR
jgi:hypothetical protein